MPPRTLYWLLSSLVDDAPGIDLMSDSTPPLGVGMVNDAFGSMRVYESAYLSVTVSPSSISPLVANTITMLVSVPRATFT